MKAIDTDDERLSLECLRYQNNIQNVAAIGARALAHVKKMNQLQTELTNTESQLAMFVAEAMDQKRVLLEAGLSEEEIEKLAVINDPELNQVVDSGTKITNILKLIGKGS
jgi:16S rRNA G527 N7-methylase RsmG